jgi:hypothetical protein
MRRGRTFFAKRPAGALARRLFQSIVRRVRRVRAAQLARVLRRDGAVVVQGIGSDHRHEPEPTKSK